MFGLSKLFGGFNNSTTKKAKQEFFKILELEDKRLKMVKEYGDNLPEDVSITQKDILKNNLLTLAKVIDVDGGFDNPMKKMLKQEYFNIQGTKPQVHSVSYDKFKHNDNFSHKDFPVITPQGTKTVTCDRIDTGAFATIVSEMLELSEKFMKLKSGKLKSTVRNKLVYLAEQKIVEKVQEFAERFVGNEQLVKEYIFSGLKGEDDHWHDYKEFKARLNFMGLLYYRISRGPINESTDFDIDIKKLIYIYSNEDLQIEKILGLLDIKRHDFIVCEHKNLGIMNGY
jgi:hypothetical protein